MHDRLPAEFGDPWEHTRLLSDRPRNDALVRMLTARAPGNRVLEVGCGTGLLSCIAAKLGAAHVYAVESTEVVERTRALVLANGLEGQVTVLHGKLQDLEPRPVDLAFSELLNADPFLEGVIPAMDAAAAWLAPGGRMSPRRLKVYVALAWVPEPAEEFEVANKEVRRLCAEHALDPGPLLASLDVWHPMRFVTHGERAVSTIACVMDLPIGTNTPPPTETEAVVWSRVDGAVGGALVWFSAELDDEIWMSNPPGAGTHWGQMVCGWTRPLKVKTGDRIRLVIRRIGAELVVSPYLD
ncbi:MAG: class I SAM-dependent methyltransferase [Myxococcota bacterium]